MSDFSRQNTKLVFETNSTFRINLTVLKYTHIVWWFKILDDIIIKVLILFSAYELLPCQDNQIWVCFLIFFCRVVQDFLVKVAQEEEKGNLGTQGILDLKEKKATLD